MIDVIEQFVIQKLGDHPKRLKHVFGVKDTAVILAKIHGIDQEQAAIAALFHDVTKYDSIEAQKQLLDENSMMKYAEYPVMYHALSAAKLLETVFDIHDLHVLNAIKHHIWGTKDMTTLEKIIFIADSCEPNREFDDAPIIFELAKKDLDHATMIAMKASIDYLEKKGYTPSQEQLDAYHYYQEVIRGKIK
jgi:predicted HD superfamily hydrolase involved in NAD metabolism